MARPPTLSTNEPARNRHDHAPLGLWVTLASARHVLPFDSTPALLPNSAQNTPARSDRPCGGDVAQGALVEGRTPTPLVLAATGRAGGGTVQSSAAWRPAQADSTPTCGPCPAPARPWGMRLRSSG